MKTENRNGKGDEIRIIEEKIHPDILSEFFRYLEDETLQPSDRKDPKVMFTILARDGSIESLRKIEAILKENDLSEDNRDFGIAALNYCRFRIENDLLDFPMDMISGGLGGVDNKMRIYVAVAGEEQITEGKLKFIKGVFEEVAGKRDSVVEEVTNHGFYVSLLMLLSFDYAYGDLIEAGISQCEFLASDYYTTNVEIPTDSRIRDWLDGKLDEDEFSQKSKT